MKKTTIIAFVIVLAVVAGLAWFLLSTPAASLGASEELKYADANSVLYAAMVSGGIEDSFVNINEDMAIVAYELPAGFDSDTMQAYVISAAAHAGVGTQKAVALQFQGGVAKSLWSVSMSDYEDFAAGKITFEQLDSKIEKKAL